MVNPIRDNPPPPFEENALNKRLMIAAALVSTALSVSAAETRPSPPDAGAALFGVRESVQQMDISPDGNRLVYLTPGPGRSTLVYVAALAGGAPQLAIASKGDAEQLQGCRFASNQRLICKLYAWSELRGVATGFTRLLALDTDGKNVKALNQQGSQYASRLQQFGDAIIDWLPDAEGQVLMARDYVPEAGKMNTRFVQKADGLGIDRIDVSTLESTRVESAAKAVDYFISDGHGTVRMKAYTPQHGARSQLAAQTTYNYRLRDSMDWRPFSNSDEMTPIAVDRDSDSAYVLKKLDKRLALYRVKLDGSMSTELVYKNDRVDVDDVVRIGRSARVIGVTFVEEKRSVIYFDPEYKKLSAALGKAIPNLPIVKFLAATADQNKLLIYAHSDADPGRYFVYDKTKRALNEVMLDRPALETVKLANVKPISYPASDGALIPGYLTLPPGKEDAHGLPAVVLPHGGPQARDEWGFDWLAQYLAHAGYAVIQPNYRGSAGYGDAWFKENGYRGWRTSIGDVTSAAHWLVAQGIADPKRLAIVGWSYGGYAALQSGVTDPELFKAIVAIAPVTDFALLKREARDYTSHDLVVDLVGSGPHLTEGSPLQNVDKIKAPVLLFHGSKDLNVDIEQSQKLDAKLRAAGKNCELLEFAGLEHSLVDSDVRVQMLGRIGKFLQANLAE